MHKFGLLNVVIIFLLAGCSPQMAQKLPAVESPSVMRGANGEGRNWWDLKKYELYVIPDIPSKSLEGNCIIDFTTLKSGRYMQIDLQKPMEITSVNFVAANSPVAFSRVSDNVYFIDFGKNLKAGKNYQINIHYAGVPKEAVMPPWDGGLQWTTDSLGRDWVTVACQGKGASVWWPCKDIQSDEPDHGVDLFITAPADLAAIGNGKLISKKPAGNNKVIWHWRVINPINNYSVTMDLGHYALDSFIYHGKNGDLPCSIYLIDYARNRFPYMRKEVTNMLDCFEEKVGHYPFYADGYKITQTPFLGMEHQSNIAYGNKFLPGYLGMDRSETGLGLQWDFIVVHESGHEWFGNSITAADVADNWLHEGFTTYLETILTECKSDAETARRYVIGQQHNIINDKPLIGQYGVNDDITSDIYDKGANVISMLRLIMQDDSKFYAMLQNINERFYHKIITSAEMEKFIIDFSGINFKPFFDQYLRTVKYPVIGYKLTGATLEFQLIEGASFPVAYLDNNGKRRFITPSTQKKRIDLPNGFAGWDHAFLLKIKPL